MKMFFTNKILVIIEIIVVLLCIVWYYKNTKQEEPLIGLIISCSVLIASCLTILNSVRPKLEFHHQQAYAGHYSKGLTSNNPPIIEDLQKVERHYEIVHGYDLELRNNSSCSAYNIEIDFNNKPKNLKIQGEVGKIEPILANERKEFHYKVLEYVTGTADVAKNTVRELPENQLKEFQIIIKYSDEDDNRFSTTYNWFEDTNIQNQKTFSNLFAKVGVILSSILILISLGIYGFKSYGRKTPTKVHNPAPLKNFDDDEQIGKNASNPIHHEDKAKEKNAEPSPKLEKSETKNDSIPSPIQSVINAQNALIVTSGQSGGLNTVIQKIDAPNAKFTDVSHEFNIEVEKLPPSLDPMRKMKFPSEQYPFKSFFRHSIVLDYSSQVPTNGFAFAILKNDLIKGTVSSSMVFSGNGKTPDGFPYVSVSRPTNGRYTFTFYTITKVNGINDFRFYKNIN